MNICLLTRYFDLRNGGLGRFSTAILRGLHERGYPIRMVYTEKTTLTSYLWYTAAGITGQMPRRQDVYHALTPMESIWIPKARSVVTFHDLFLLKYPERCGAGTGGSGWKVDIARAWFGLACTFAVKARAIACVSEMTRHDLMGWFGVPGYRINVIRPGLGPGLKPEPKRDTHMVLGYLGQLDRRKRVGMLVRAFRRSSLDAELRIAGTGADEQEIRECANGDSRITFLGSIPDAELAAFYNSLDLFVFPTWLEGYGLPPIEAMACRRPTAILGDAIIPFDVAFRCYSVGDLRWLFRSKDNIHRAIDSINYDDNYRFAREHDWDICVDEYIRLYESIPK